MNFKINALCRRCRQPVKTECGVMALCTATIIGMNGFWPEERNGNFFLCRECANCFGVWLDPEFYTRLDEIAEELMKDDGKQSEM